MRWCKIEGDTTDRNRSALVKAFEAGKYQVRTQWCCFAGLAVAKGCLPA